MNTKLVNREVLKVLTKKELFRKYAEYWRLGEEEGRSHFFAVAKEYLKEYNKRTD